MSFSKMSISQHRLAFIAISYTDKYDGISVYIENLLSEVINLLLSRNSNIRIDIFCGSKTIELLKNRVNFDETMHMHMHFIPIYDKSMLWKIFDTTKKLFLNRNYDLIFLPNPIPLPFTFGKTLHVIHDLSYKVVPEYHSPKTIIYANILLKMSFWRDEEIGYISNTTRNDLNRFFHINEKTKKLIYLPNGLPFKVTRFKRPNNFYRDEKFSSNTLVLLVVGRINKHKGFDRILEFCNYYEKDAQNFLFKKAVLHVVGKQTDETKALIRNNAFHHIEIIFHGFTDDQTLNKIYMQSQFCFFLSRNEGFGIPLIEALWFKTIPLLSDIPIFHEIMGDTYPKFNDASGYGQAIFEFITQIFEDLQYRNKLYNDLELIVKAQTKGYSLSAENLLNYFEVDIRIMP